MAMDKLEIETYFGKCKCCLKYGYLRPMWDKHVVEEEPEVYGKMLTQCFSIPWTIENSEDEDQICEDCIWKLREAHKFKQQILQNRINMQSTESEEYLEEIKVEAEDEYDVEYLDEDILTKNAEDIVTETNEQNGDTEMDYLEDVEEYDDDDDDFDFKADDYDEKEESKDEDLMLARPSPRKRAPPKQENTDSDTDTPKPKWPKKLPKEERWKTYRQYTEEDMKQAVEAVLNKRMNQKQASTKFHVPAKTLGAKIRSIKDSDVYLPTNNAAEFAAEIETLLRYFNVTPFRNRAGRPICFFCPNRIEFESPEQLRVHSRLDHLNKTGMVLAALRPSWTNELVKIDIHDVKCLECNEDFYTWVQVHGHLQQAHDITLQYKHRLVPFRLGNSNKCVVCSESFTAFTQLDNHMNQHFSNYMCGHCGDPFASSQRLKAHERTHDTGCYPCRLCNKVFTLEKYMRKHITLKHMKVAKSKCPYCSEVFITDYNRQTHISKEHTEHLQTYTCELCGDTFDWMRTFVRHMTRKHSTEFNCNTCGKSFASKKILEEHRWVHKGDNFECPICNKCYLSYSSLKSHVKYSHKNNPDSVKGLFGIS